MRNKSESFGRIDLPHASESGFFARLASWWQNFWFTPTDPIGLHVIRVLSGLVFLAWLLPMAGYVDAFYGMQGLFDSEAYRAASRMPDAPVPINWSLLYLVGDNGTALHAMFWLAIGSFALFTLGVATRLTGVLTWLFVVSFGANPGTKLDADDLLGILAFYLMIAYFFHGLFGGDLTFREKLLGSDKNFLLARFLGKKPRATRLPSYAANLTLRVLQVHLALIILTSGLHKLQFGDWWSGMALWYPLHPPFRTTQADLQRLAPNAAAYAFVLSIVNYAVLAWQISFPFWAWRAGARAFLLGGLALGWIGASFVYGLPFFGPFFFIAGLSFVPAEQWRRLADSLAGLVGSAKTSRPAHAEKKTPLAAGR